MQLAYVYCDLGDQRYKALVDSMVTSARAVMPDVRITQISDNKTPIYPGVDASFIADVACDKESICSFKGHFMAEFAMQCSDDLILCDVDLIWQKKPDFCDLNSDYLGVMYRQMPSMPINSGIILSTSNAHALWKEYQLVVDDLQENKMGGWFCDQIAAAIAWTRSSKISYLTMQEWGYVPDGPYDQRGKDAHALHLKGNRKQWLQQFKRKAA